MVGGLPKVRKQPWEYKAVFSPSDVIEEYTRPARIVRNGKEVVLPALCERELVDIEGIGTLEAFISDGLRSLIRTMDVPDMEEKTMRYPGHARMMEIMRDAGFFNPEKKKLGDAVVSPLEMTSSILFDQWKLEEGEVDITVMKIVAEGMKGGQAHRITYDLYDEYDHVSKIHSMARTTGYTATITARMVLNGMYGRKGISPPEYLGKHQACVDFLFDEFEKRNINYVKRVV
jgi:saccharopine dehydrogenase-like NADP-dependent oxidoreductase